MSRVERLKRRREFLKVAGQGRKWAAPGLVLQALPSSDETPGEPAPEGARLRYGLTASRRLKLAAKESGAALFVLRAFADAEPTAARRRWGVAAAPGPPRPWRGAAGLPALGAPRWVVVEERGRGQDGAAREVEWDEQALCFREPQPMADRTAGADRPQKKRRAG